MPSRNAWNRGGSARRVITVVALVTAMLLAITGCRRGARQPSRGAAAGGPRFTATVLSIQTTIQPSNKTLVHTIAIAGDRARSSNELDQWRLFDLRKNEVTWVDDIARTYRRESLASILARRRAALAGPLPRGIPPSQVVRSAAKKVVSGVEATQMTVRAGGYARELWVGAPPAVPPLLFSMMHASEVPTSSLAPMMRAADEALLAIRGFPLAEHAELPLDEKKLVVDKTVVAIQSRSVPEAYLNVPATYKDVTPKPKPAQRRRVR